MVVMEFISRGGIRVEIDDRACCDASPNEIARRHEVTRQAVAKGVIAKTERLRREEAAAGGCLSK